MPRVKGLQATCPGCAASRPRARRPLSRKGGREPQTVATAIKIGNPFSWKAAERARNESRGLIESVTDAEILLAYEMLASTEGVFCEPASAASLAGVIKKNKEGYFIDGERRVVCTLTGHGLKDPDTAILRSSKPTVIKPVMDEILRVLKL